MNRRKGFTLIELLVVVAIIALLIGLLLPALAKAHRNAQSLRDKAQAKQIHQSMLVFANDNNDILPTPGLINRNADPYTGGHHPGIGPENVLENTTGNLYSAMIAQEFFNTDILIGPTESNPMIVEYENYNFQFYNPGTDQYWDRAFRCLLGGPQCNSSYYHMVLTGQRKKTKWRNTSHEGDPILSTRGTLDGVETGIDYEGSYTLLLHGPKKEWMGNIAYADNHTKVSNTFYPSLVSYEPQTGTGYLTKDNIFTAEFTDFTNNYESGDAWLAVTQAVSPTGIPTLGIEDLVPGYTP